MNVTENLKTPIKEECDVLVCGGGIAGVSAAISAARLNKKVILCERAFMLGGLATAGLITIYLPLCDGMGRQVSYGVVEELLKLSIEHKCYPTRGYNDWIANPDTKKNEDSPRYEVDFNPILFAISAEKLLLDSGVKILYGTIAVNAYQEDGKISCVVFENKSGRFAVRPKSVVDATGDADIVNFLAMPQALHEAKNPLASWYYYYKEGTINLKQFGASDITEEEEKKRGYKIMPISNRRFLGVDGEELSEITQFSHKAILNDYIKQKANYADYDITSIATIPQIRMTRRLVGEYELDETDEHKEFSDSIGLICNWKKRGPVYEIPLRTLYSKSIKNLCVAGRCISVTDRMWNISRVIPPCAVTGQAAGTMAAITDDFTALDVKKLQEQLIKDGVVLHEKDL